MRILKACAAAAAIGSAVNMASAALLVADGFNYTAPGALTGNTDTDFSTNPATWAVTGGATSGPTVVANSVTYTGPGALPQLPGSSSAQIVTTTGGATRIQLATPVANGTFSQANNPGTTLYYSFTMDVTNISVLSTGVNGSFIAGFNNATGTQGSTLTAAAGVLCINKLSASATTFQLGVAQQNATGRTFNLSNQYSQNDPLFIVVAYNFGATAGTDSADLYVFDSAAGGGIGDTIPASQPGTATAHGAYTAEISHYT